MNGYLEALKLDINEQKRLQSDKALLAKTVESAAERYLAKVENLNQE